jgi:hypothetical protein
LLEASRKFGPFIAGALRMNKTLEKLKYSRSLITEADIKLLCEAIHFNSSLKLKLLDLSRISFFLSFFLSLFIYFFLSFFEIKNLGFISY